MTLITGLGFLAISATFVGLIALGLANLILILVFIFCNSQKKDILS
jgi:hypothetical protein